MFRRGDQPGAGDRGRYLKASPKFLKYEVSILNQTNFQLYGSLHSRVT